MDLVLLAYIDVPNDWTRTSLVPMMMTDRDTDCTGGVRVGIGVVGVGLPAALSGLFPETRWRSIPQGSEVKASWLVNCSVIL